MPLPCWKIWEDIMYLSAALVMCVPHHVDPRCMCWYVIRSPGLSESKQFSGKDLRHRRDRHSVSVEIWSDCLTRKNFLKNLSCMHRRDGTLFTYLCIVAISNWNHPVLRHSKAHYKTLERHTSSWRISVRCKYRHTNYNIKWLHACRTICNLCPRTNGSLASTLSSYRVK